MASKDDSAFENAFADAKAYLQTASSGSGINLYDHLANVISNILDERPSNAADVVENVSLKVKSRAQKTASVVADSPAGTEAVAAATTRSALFEKPEEEEDLDDEETEPPVADVVGTCRLFEDAGVGIG
jgi:radial spoke head protein 4A